MANYGLINNLSALPLHSTNQYDSELIVVDNNAGRPITARASYITNLNDLVISLSADHISIGDFNIADPEGLNANVLGAGVGKGGLVTLIADTTSGLLASVASVGGGQGALRVLTQDLDSVHDSITIGDQNGNFAYVTNSALNVFVTNGISAVAVTNFPIQLTAVSITNQLTGITVLNPVTAVRLTNPLSAVTVLNPVSSFSLTNQITSVSITNFPTQLTSVNVTNFPTQLTAVSLTNPVTAVTVLNPITSVNIKSLVSNWDVLSAAIDNTTYTTLPSNPANEITVLNNTGNTIYIKNSAKTIGLPIDNNTSVDLKLVGDTSEVAIKASGANKTVFATFISYN